MTFADMCGGYDFGKPLAAFELTAEQESLVLAVARDWQSPGSIGRELATLASTRVVTDELGDDISRTIRQVRGMDADPDLELNIADLRTVASLLGFELDGDI